MSSTYSDEYSSTNESKSFDGGSDKSDDLLSVLSSRGKIESTYRVGSKYIMHINSAFLLHIVDEQYIRAKCGNYTTHDHGDICKSSDCAFKRENGTVEFFKHKDCPCKDLLKINPDAKEICFRRFLINTSSFEVQIEREINPEDVMVCMNHDSIFSDRYRLDLAKTVGFSGWIHLSTIEQLIKLLNTCYWFRSQEKKKEASLSLLIKKISKKFSIKKFLGIIKSVIFTINGILTKTMLVFPANTPSHARIASTTYKLFVEFLISYTTDVGNISETDVYIDYKNLMDSCKVSFHNMEITNRVSWMSYEFKNAALADFFEPYLLGLYGYVSYRHSTALDDYTSSYAWFIRCAMFCQKRNVGYLPEAISQSERNEFRKLLVTKAPLRDNHTIKLVSRFLIDELKDAKVPENIFLDNKGDRKKILDSMISHTDLTVKPTASVDHTVKQGGKIEDARILYRLAYENKWEIPIYDMESGIIRDTIVLSHKDEQEEMSYLIPIFWISFQCIINLLIDKKILNPKYKRPFPMLNGEMYWYPKDIDSAEIVHISEPAKERNLIKSHSYLAWVLTPAAKLLQAYIAQHPSHKVGLLGASHMWEHVKRCSPKNPETGFIYNGKGLIRPNIISFFEDWSQSTDFIDRQTGLALLKTLMDFSQFPKFYGGILQAVITLPQNVREKLSNGEYWRGRIYSGFMMGMPMTKVILHAHHLAEMGGVKYLLKLKGKIRLKSDRKPEINELGQPIDKHKVWKETMSELWNPIILQG
jgi:hypothetical protein